MSQPLCPYQGDKSGCYLFVTYDVFLCYFGEIVQMFLIKLFRTVSGKWYVYDATTNIIHSFTKSNITVRRAKKIVQQYQISKKLGTKHRFENIYWPLNPNEVLLNNSTLKQMTLQITQECNLRCKYCVYSGHYKNFHEHTAKHMDRHTLCQSLDYFLDHCDCTSPLHIVFYGGEALLAFDMIQYAVSFVKNQKNGLNITFGISSNGTTVTEDFVEWLEKNPEVSITITLNGPYHNIYRTDRIGQGSLSAVMKGVKLLKKSPYVWENQVKFIANLSSPLQVKTLLQFYNEEVGVLPNWISYIRQDYSDDTIMSLFENDEEADNSAENMLMHEYVSYPNSSLDIYFKDRIGMIENRAIVDADTPAYICSCIPGYEKLFVNTDGLLNMVIHQIY